VDTGPVSDGTIKRRPLWLRLAPLVVLAAMVVAAFALGVQDVFSFDTLRDNRALLRHWVDEYGVLFAAAYMIVYAAVVALSLPAGSVLTVAGGFCFGTVLGTVYTVAGATAGATALFLIATTALGDSLRERAGPAVRKMRAGFQENAFHYLMFLRLVPAFPFWLVNLAPALLGVPLRTYVIATVIGIVPGTFVLALAGAGLGSVLDQGGTFTPASVLTPQIIGGLTGLALLALVPVIVKSLRKSKKN